MSIFTTQGNPEKDFQHEECVVEMRRAYLGPSGFDGDIVKRYLAQVRKKHRKTLEAIFMRPTQSGVTWADIESLFVACGAYIEEREGSRVYVELNDVVGHFHRPHPEKEARKGAVDSVRRFLKEAGIEK